MLADQASGAESAYQASGAESLVLGANDSAQHLIKHFPQYIISTSQLYRLSQSLSLVRIATEGF